MTRTYKFTGHPKAAAAVLIYGDGAMALKSYNTIVITVDVDGWIHVNGLYSATTRKHIAWFMRELGLSYYDAKTMWEAGFDYNPSTGEIRFL